MADRKHLTKKQLLELKRFALTHNIDDPSLTEDD